MISSKEDGIAISALAIRTSSDREVNLRREVSNMMKGKKDKISIKAD